MPDQMSERDEVTLRILAIIDGTSLAGQRRQALHVYAERARQNPDVAEIVRLTLAARRERQTGDSNVISLRRGHA